MKKAKSVTDGGFLLSGFRILSLLSLAVTQPAMEVSGVRLRYFPSLSDAGFRSVSDSRPGETFPSSSLAFSTRQRRGSCSLGVSRCCETSAGFAVSYAFADDGRLRYYGSPICGGKKEKKEESKAIKKKLKLLKGLSKDLSAFSGIGFGLEEDAGMVGEVKGKSIADAAEVLMSQLRQLRAQEKEMKRKRKAEKAARMKATMDDTDTSSSESSACGAVVNMSRLSEALTDPGVSEAEATESFAESPLCEAESIPLKTKVDQLEAILRNDPPAEESHANQFLKGGVLAEAKIDHPLASPDQASASISKLPSSQSLECGPCCGNKVMVESSSDRIEVCMGGKCKKSGALLLLEEFEKKVGATVEVVGCKCMGKCRNGPNVRVINHSNGQEEDSVKLPAANPLCLGVSLEDVGIILANFFGQQTDMGLVAV